jgi:hypothetical protein
MLAQNDGELIGEAVPDECESFGGIDESKPGSVIVVEIDTSL